MQLLIALLAWLGVVTASDNAIFQGFSHAWQRRIVGEVATPHRIRFGCRCSTVHRFSHASPAVATSRPSWTVQMPRRSSPSRPASTATSPFRLRSLRESMPPPQTSASTKMPSPCVSPTTPPMWVLTTTPLPPQASRLRTSSRCPLQIQRTPLSCAASHCTCTATTQSSPRGSLAIPTESYVHCLPQREGGETK